MIKIQFCVFLFLLILNKASAADSCDAYGSSATYQETITQATVAIRNIVSNGCPNHYSICTGKSGVPGCGAVGVAGTASEAKQQSKNINIPANPVLRANSGTKSIKCQMGAVAIALNGVSIYSGAVNSQCGQLDVDSSSGEWSGFDCCSGHSEKTGDYHYHFPPSCLIAQTKAFSNGHSAQVGWSYDGFPIYGPYGQNGKYLQKCSINSATPCLDECGGLESELPDVDKFKYRYYMTGNTSDLNALPSNPKPSTAYAPYTFDCYRGCTYSELTAGTCSGTNGYTTSYTPSATTGYTAKSEVVCLSGKSTVSSTSSTTSTTTTTGSTTTNTGSTTTNTGSTTTNTGSTTANTGSAATNTTATTGTTTNTTKSSESLVLKSLLQMINVVCFIIVLSLAY